MNTTIFSVSKTGTVGLVNTDISTDKIGLTVECTTTSSNKLSIQVAGTITSATPYVSNDGVNYVAYTQLRNASGASVTSITTAGLYSKLNESDYYAYLRLVLVGVDATTLITVRGIY